MSQKKLKKNNINNYSLIDLFCGIGGLTHGFVKENFKIDAGIDFDSTCKFAFEKNNNASFYSDDVTLLKGDDLLKRYRKNTRKILVGCAPCQPFSLQKNKNLYKDSSSEDSKWKLLYSFADLIEQTDPEIISMENVPQLLKFKEGKVFNDFVERLEKKGYKLSYSIVNAQDYGVPQRRKRLVLLGSKHGFINLIEKTTPKGHHLSVRDAIGHLPPVEDGIAHPSDSIHIARKLTDLNKKRIQASVEGGFWRNWDESLWLECHKKESGKAFGSVYGRMKWDEVAPTMTTCCTGLSNGRFGHPEQDRAITLREAALLQSFPINYQFTDSSSKIPTQTIARQIGNAVPVGLGIAIAKSIKNHIESLE
ncbi:DNA cytosine methyltransferase [Flavobacterium sp. LS2P90]|uniref:DNA (cytosine-5-)-methyltransferase n=1 Tax=Flavobacterium xylosi TaxID=3230415 RepID=A0ABW6HST5_9FLAO